MADVGALSVVVVGPGLVVDGCRDGAGFGVVYDGALVVVVVGDGAGGLVVVVVGGLVVVVVCVGGGEVVVGDVGGGDVVVGFFFSWPGAVSGDA